MNVLKSFDGALESARKYVPSTTFPPFSRREKAAAIVRMGIQTVTGFISSLTTDRGESQNSSVVRVRSGDTKMKRPVSKYASSASPLPPLSPGAAAILKRLDAKVPFVPVVPKAGANARAMGLRLEDPAGEMVALDDDPQPGIS